MNKKEFLDKLEKKLSILDESERKDILDEYKDTISEKVKHGQSEEEAVADFGDVDELVKEILSAYKIDPDFEGKDENTFNKLLSDGEDLIKKGADKLAKTSKGLASDFKRTNKEINLSLIFEIVIKIIITIFLIGILRLPFMLIYEVGKGMLDSIFAPFEMIFSFLFGVLLLIVYLSLCVLVIVSLFKGYFKHDDTSLEDAHKEEEENKNSEVKEKSPVKKGRSTLGEAIILIIKIWVVIFIMVPAVFVNLCILFGLCLAIIYLIKGINLFGLGILLLGCLIMCTWFIKLIYGILFKAKKVNVIPLIISIILMMVGGLLFADMIINIDYYDKVPSNIEKESKSYEYKIDERTVISNLNGYTEEIVKDMKDGEIKVEVDYYKEATKIKIDDYDAGDYRRIAFVNNYTGINPTKFMYNNFIDNLKDNKIYNYNDVYAFNIKVYGNEKTLAMVEEE